MKIYTPQISWHDRQPILSVDIQNRAIEDSHLSHRLATGGNDSRVNIWKITLNQTCQDAKKPIEAIDCLAELTQHQRSVNIVRFSPNLDDNLLASGDDDSLIFIWKLFNDENSPKKGNVCENGKGPAKTENADNLLEADAISVEIWKPYKILRGHNQDVTDISWSKDGQNLVSGSVDNNVFVWDIHRGTKLHKLVKEHYSYVQGVSWDPLNRYITSLSADRNMLIFNVKSGKTVHRVYKITYGEEEKKATSKLFFDQTLMSFCRRLSFSPGGELLFAPSGILETGSDDFKNTVYIFERHSLNRPSFYLPTNKFSVAVSCCPVVFELKSGIANNFKFPYRIVFAVATQDSVLLYDTQQLFPFAYVSQIHYLRLTDLAWSPDGRVLIVTSTDGFSTFVVFDENELGLPYQGNLLELEVLEPAAATVTSEVKSAKKQNNGAKSVLTEKAQEKVKTPKTPLVKNTPTPSKNITTFFKKLSPHTANLSPSGLASTPKTAAPIAQASISGQQEKAGRRVSLITLFAPKPDEKKSENVNPSSSSLPTSTEHTAAAAAAADQYETGMKRKLSENETEKEKEISVIDVD